MALFDLIGMAQDLSARAYEQAEGAITKETKKTKDTTSETKYLDPSGAEQTGYIIGGQTFKDPGGTQRIDVGSQVETEGGWYELTDTGGVKIDKPSVKTVPTATKTTFYDPSGQAQTGYIIDGKTYMDPEGKTRVPMGSQVPTAGGWFELTEEGGVQVQDPTQAGLEMPEAQQMGDFQQSWAMAGEISGAVAATQLAGLEQQKLAVEQSVYNTAKTIQTMAISDRYRLANYQAVEGVTGGVASAQQAQLSAQILSQVGDLYSQADFEKLGIESEMANVKAEELLNRYDIASDMYSKAVDKAITEANLTGVYVSPEANHLYEQMSYADKIISDPNSSDLDVARAENIKRTSSQALTDMGYDPSEAGMQTMADRKFEADLEAQEFSQWLDTEYYDLAQKEYGLTYDKFQQDQAEFVSKSETNYAYDEIYSNIQSGAAFSLTDLKNKYPYADWAFLTSEFKSYLTPVEQEGVDLRGVPSEYRNMLDTP